MRDLLAALFLFAIAPLVDRSSIATRLPLSRRSVCRPSSGRGGELGRSPVASRMSAMPAAAAKRLDIRIIGIDFGAPPVLTLAALMSLVAPAS